MKQKSKNLENPETISKNEEVDKQLSIITAKLKNSSKKVIRISTETSIAIATICNYFIENLIIFVINEIVSNGKKVFDIAMIMNLEHKNNLYYLILNKLPSFLNYDVKKYEEQKKEHQEFLKKNKKEKNATSADNNSTNENKKEEKEQKKTNGESEVKENNKIYFTSYVNDIIKTNINKITENNDKDAKKDFIRITKDVKVFLSTLIIECIRRYITLVKIIAKEFSKIRISPNHLKTIIHLCMKDEGKEDSEILQITNIIDEKIKLYNDHIKSDKKEDNNKKSKKKNKQDEDIEKVTKITDKLIKK